MFKFLKKRGDHDVPAAFKLFKVKPIAELFYGAQLGPFSNFAPLELVQSKFLRSVLQAPKCSSNATLRLETGLVKLEARVWATISTAGLKDPFFLLVLPH